MGLSIAAFSETDVWRHEPEQRGTRMRRMTARMGADRFRAMHLSRAERPKMENEC